MGVDLDRIGRHVVADHDGGLPLPHPQLVPDPELAQIGLGLRPPDVEEMTRVVEDVAIFLDAPAGASRLGLALEYRGVDPGRREPLGGHQTGQSTADDQVLHFASMSTRPSQIRIASTITATTPLTIRVVIGSR